jgi:hypothetical protein
MRQKMFCPILKGMMKRILVKLLLPLLLFACTPAVAPPTATPLSDTPSPTDPPTAVPTATPTAIMPTPMGLPPTSAQVALYPDEDERADYLVWQLDDTLVQSFEAAHETAVAQNESWVQDPYEVAWRFVDMARRFSDEPFPYEESFYLPADPGEATFIVILGEFKDDSVWGNKLRLELVAQDEAWQVAWVGEMWRCRRGGAELEDNWHTTLCP